MDQGNRGTGKTTRMLNQAMAAAMEGSTVFVIGSNAAHCKQMMNLLRMQPGVPHFAVFHYTNMEISLWPKGQIRFKTALDQDWEPKTERVLGYPPLPTFIDHSTDPKVKLNANRASSSTKESPNTSKTSESSSGGHLKH